MHLAVAAALVAACGDSDHAANDATDTAIDAAEDGAPDIEDDAEADAPDVDDADSDDAPDGDPSEDSDASEDGDAGDAAPDADPNCPQWWEDIARTDGAPMGDGPDPGQPLEAGEARGGRVRSGDGGFVGPYAACRAGDWVLENEHLRVCIADERSMTPMLFDGGNIVDIERTDDPGRDELYYLVTAGGFLNQGADRVELLRDGADGGPAVLRVVGPDTLTMFGAATVGDLIQPIYLDFVTEYRLAPGATSLEAVTWVQRADGRRAVVQVGDLVGGGDTTRGWFDPFGFAPPILPGPASLYVSVGEAHSVGIRSESMTTKDLFLPEVDIPFGNVYSATGVLCPDYTASYRRHITVGGGDTWSVRAMLGEHAPPRAGVEVTFTSAAPDRRWEIRDGEGRSVDVVRPAAAPTGTLPEGAYVAVPLDWPGATAPEVAFDVPAAEPVALPAPELGTIEVRITDDGDRPIPASVHLVGPVTRTVVARPPVEAFELPPGTYDVWVSRGFEWSYAQTTVTVIDGDRVVLGAALARELDTTGWVGGDMHQHATPSPDSVVSLEDRVRVNLGAGVDFIAPSDHDAVGDFAGTIAALGVGDYLHLLLGEELSPGQGHINLFPRTFDRQAPYAGAIPLGYREAGGRALDLPRTGTYVATARNAGVELVMINHPRGPLSHFSGTGFDPVAGPDAVDDENWFDDFDAIEVYNLPGRFCTGLHDWFGLVAHGRDVTGVGNSDTHNLDEPSGWPRTYVASATDDPAELTNDALLSGLDAGTVTVSGGLFVDFADGAVRPGDTLTASADAPTTLQVRVRAASWVAVESLVTFVDGAEVARTALTWPEDGPNELVVPVEVAAEDDAFVVFVAYASTPLPAVFPGKRPFGFTNPVFLDVGGDGWTAPGVADAAALPVPTGLPNCN